ACREARRIDLGASRSSLQHPGLVVAAVQPRSRSVDGETVDPGGHSGTREPRGVTVRRAALATTTFLIALYAASPWLAERLVPPLLARWGVEEAQLSIGYPTLRGLDVERFAARASGVAVDGGATRIDWSLAALLRGDLESIVIEELRVRVAPQ